MENKDLELVPVLETGDQVLLALFKSALEEKAIPYQFQVNEMQELFPGASVNYSPAVGQILVQKKDEQRAGRLLEELETH